MSEQTRSDAGLVTTRRALHAVAELVLAGPQYAASGTIRLRVVPGGFATVAAPDLRVEGAEVVAGGRRAAIDGASPDGLAAALGVECRTLEDVYAAPPAAAADDRLALDPACAAELLDALAVGDAALRTLHPDGVPVLWPEHLDVGIAVDEVNYGVSPGDDLIGVPYAYVGPWTPPPADEFWDRPFGAARPVADLGDAAGAVAFFEDARRRLGR
jgi:hypothetical protein